jgi:hypothetical protein
MIRFVYIGNQIDCTSTSEKPSEQFAWWDTITDSFMEFDHQVVFDSWEEFENAVRNDEYSHDLNRFKYLFTKGNWYTDEEDIV